MKIVFFVTLIILLLLLILFVPISANAKFIVNVLDKSAFLSVTNPLIKIITGKFFLNNDFSFSTIMHTNKMLDSKDPDEVKMNTIKEMIKRCKIKMATVYIDGGKGNDAYLTAMFIGTSLALVNSFSTIFNKKIEKSKIRITPTYHKNELLMALEVIIKIRIIDMIITLIKAKIDYKKQIEEEQKYA